MPRPLTETLTPREAEIMGVLWRLHTASAEQIREQLTGTPHDSSVRTLLRVLEKKGALRRTRDGKADVYEPILEQASAQTQAVTGLLQRLFRGSAASLVLRLLEEEEISPAELERLAREARGQSTPAQKRLRKKRNSK